MTSDISNNSSDNSADSLDNSAIFAEAEIKQLEERLRQAMLTNNIAELDHLISERLLFVGPDGAIANKAADIQARQTGVVMMSELTPLSQRLEQYGSVIVVVASMQITGTFAGTPFAGQFRYVRVWQQEPLNNGAGEGSQFRVVAGSVVEIR